MSPQRRKHAISVLKAMSQHPNPEEAIEDFTWDNAWARRAFYAVDCGRTMQEDAAIAALLLEQGYDLVDPKGIWCFERAPITKPKF